MSVNMSAKLVMYRTCVLCSQSPST